MIPSSNVCAFCGSPLKVDSKFCENCGAAVAPPPSSPPVYAAPPPPPVYTPPPSPPAYVPPVRNYPPPQPPYARPYQPPPKQSNPCLVILGIGCILIICLACLAIGAYFVMGNQISAIFDSIQATLIPPSYLPQVQTDFSPTGTPIPPIIPIPPISSGPTGQQQVTEYSIFDDFSSNALNWDQSSTEISVHSYEQGAYFIHVKQPSYISWANVPVNFTPYEIEFDVQAPLDKLGGVFGVMCQFQDENNYYSVEIDVNDQDFSIAKMENDEAIPLTDPEWMPLNGLYTILGSTNHVAVSCYPDWIGLYINGEMAGQVDFSGQAPFTQPGSMALYVATWETVGSEGYWVYFDNVSAWKPVQ